MSSLSHALVNAVFMHTPNAMPGTPNSTSKLVRPQDLLLMVVTAAERALEDFRGVVRDQLQLAITLHVLASS